MIYSRWRADRGGYDYFRSSETLGMADDLPVPSLSCPSAIGCPSTEAGRKPPSALVVAGTGALPQGLILPLDRSVLSGVGSLLDAVPAWIWLSVGITLGWYWGHR